jgi:hypothetical protein
VDTPRALDPYHNPSYTERTHLRERSQLESVLRGSEERIAGAIEKLSSISSDARQAELSKLYHQMQGARDQIAAAARRMLLEAGELYDLDKDRFQQASAALDRLWKRFEALAK